ncbi:MAG: TetR/AcrR family transcriptional regulator [Pseudomonadota bacterium]
MARRSDHSREDLTELALEAAREIVVDGGLSALSGRKVTKRIGYTIGTLYQMFDGMDDLVDRMNTQTLAALYEHCKTAVERGDVAEQLNALGLRFVEFVRAHPNEWDAIMSYRYKDRHAASEAYSIEIQRLFGLMESATGEFYGPGEFEEHATDMALLWASLTGIWAVASSERELGGTLEHMIDRLVRMYLKARA